MFLYIHIVLLMICPAWGLVIPNRLVEHLFLYITYKDKGLNLDFYNKQDVVYQ